MRLHISTLWIDHSLALALHNFYTPSLINSCVSPRLLRDGKNRSGRPGRKCDFTQGQRARKQKALELVNCRAVVHDT